MFSKTRLGASLVYVSSMLLTLYSAFSVRAMFLIVVVRVVHYFVMVYSYLQRLMNRFRAGML